MQVKSLFYWAMSALIVAGCGGGGSSSPDGSNGGSGLTLASSFTLTATGGDAGIGADPDGNLVAVVAQTGSGGVVGSLGYYPASAGKTPTFPAGYTLDDVFGVSGPFALFDVKDASGTEGALILDVNTNGSTFEAGREVEAADGDRVLTASTATGADFKIETFDSGSASVSTTQSVPLPAGVDVVQLAGDYLLIGNVQTRAHGRAARLKARANGAFSLYSTSGAKLLDYAAPVGATLASVDALNASGQAVGTVDKTAGRFGVQWDESGKATFLPGGGRYVRPGGITDAGAIVATSVPIGGTDTTGVAVYDSGGKQSTLGAIPIGFSYATITRGGKGIGTFSYDEVTGATTIHAYVLN